MKSTIKNNPEVISTMRVNKLFTLVFLKKENSVLLGFKTRGLGKGLWNGFGGKVEKDESVMDCARRELQEECSLVARDLKHVGVVKYDLTYDNSADIVHVFTCTQFEGIETPSEEMNPIKWYEFKNIPFNQMWPDSPRWYPSMLSGKYFSARITYSDENTITNGIIQEHGSLLNALKLAE